MSEPLSNPSAPDPVAYVSGQLGLLGVPWHGAGEQQAILDAVVHHWGVLRTMATIMHQGPLQPHEEPAAVFRP